VVFGPSGLGCAPRQAARSDAPEPAVAGIPSRSAAG
jgi:hypothetical protein